MVLWAWCYRKWALIYLLIYLENTHNKQANIHPTNFTWRKQYLHAEMIETIAKNGVVPVAISNV